MRLINNNPFGLRSLAIFWIWANKLAFGTCINEEIAVMLSYVWSVWKSWIIVECTFRPFDAACAASLCEGSIQVTWQPWSLSHADRAPGPEPISRISFPMAYFKRRFVRMGSNGILSK